VARVSIAGVVELLLFVLCVAQLDRILCEYSAWAIGKLGAMHCSCGTVVGVLFAWYYGITLRVSP
jgi:hypothetical protein